MAISLPRRAGAEFIGTFWLVLGGCGSAVLAAGFPHLGIGFAGVALAFGLTLLTMAYAIGHISGCHINPAVSFGLWAGGRFPGSELAPYVIAQVLGGIFAAAVLYVIASGAPGFSLAGGFASNGYGAHSPGGYSLPSALVCEVVMTLMFLFVIMGATDPRVPAGFAPIPIGLVLTLIHLISIPVTNTSVNPARSTGPALFVGGWAVEQLWLFWVAPIAGAILGGSLYRALLAESPRPWSFSGPTCARKPATANAQGAEEMAWRAAEKGKQIVRSSWIGRDVATLYELERLGDGARVSPVAHPDLLMHFLLNRRARRQNATPGLARS